MGRARAPEKVKLIAGLISNDTALFDRVRPLLEKEFGSKVDFDGPTLDFIHTDYYNEEMGRSLKRKFFSFKKTVPLTGIEKVKLLTNAIEEKYSINGKRRINIDPGYLYLYGTAGIGKTYEVMQAIKKAKIDKFWEDRIHFSQTELGKIADIRAVFAKFPQDILIFDDCDKMVSGAGGR